MGDEVLTIRKKAIDFDRHQIIQTYLKIEDGMIREEFVNLIDEAHKCFISGCPRASIVMSGETLLRAILYKIETIKSKIAISKKDEEALMSNSFSKAILVLKKNNVYSDDIIKKMMIIKGLRNIAVHGTLPLLNEWDPDEGN